jgi:hypothetical protein
MARASEFSMWKVLICSVAITAMAGGARPSAQAPANPDATAIAEYQARVKAYNDLRNKVDGGAARQTQTDDPEKLVAQKQALATNIQKQRAGAKPGDIFTPDVQPLFRRLLKPALKGADGADNAKAIKEEKPVVPLKVNVPYPEKEPLSMVPPDVLKQLPPLPKDLEYRFIMKHLILFDARANLVVDVLPNAIP